MQAAMLKSAYCRVVGGNLANFGVCINHRDNCGLSCERPSLDDLTRRILVVESQESRGIGSQPARNSLKPFLPFFQTGPLCSNCNGPLGFVTQPTANLPENSKERARTEDMNRLLDAGYKLEAMGIIPVE
jgi:hypothetical protein